MFNNQLTHAVENFVRTVLPATEKDLERAWVWKSYDEEGIRFAFFVTLQELRHLAVTLASLRSQPTLAQRILSQYHAAYMDLQAAVLDLTDEDAEKIPSEGEWQVNKVYAHTALEPLDELHLTTVRNFFLTRADLNIRSKNP